MAKREIIFVNDEIYHIVNRSIGRQPVFKNKRNCQRALNSIFFYQFQNHPSSLSHYLSLTKKQKEIAQKLLLTSNKLIETISFCLMPSHFHLLLKQKIQGGISKFLANFQNSYTRYFNLFNKRKGHLFEGQFKAVRIETEDQLLHVSRYIHLNPYSSYLIKDFSQLKDFPWSSLVEYFNKVDYQITDKKTLLSYFKPLKKFETFLFNQKDYQRELQSIKFLTLD